MWIAQWRCLSLFIDNREYLGQIHSKLNPITSKVEWTSLLLKARPVVRSDQFAQIFIQLGFENPWGWRETLWVACCTAWLFSWWKSFSSYQSESAWFQVLPVVFHHVTMHGCGEPGPIFWFCKAAVQFPWSHLFRLNKSSSLSLSSQSRSSSPQLSW